MNSNFWNTYPVIAAMTLGASGAILLLNGFYLLQGFTEPPDRIFKYQLRVAAALVLWVIGCGMASRTRHGSWPHGLLCGLLFLPGLLILLLTTGRKTRQQIWEEDTARRERQRQRRNAKRSR